MRIISDDVIVLGELHFRTDHILKCVDKSDDGELSISLEDMVQFATVLDQVEDMLQRWGKEGKRELRSIQQQIDTINKSRKEKDSG